MKPVAVLLSLLLATTSFADDEISPIDICTDFSEIARDTMIARQKDKPMSETLPLAIIQVTAWTGIYEIDIDKETIEEMAAEMVMHAYRSPSYSADGNQRSTISEFENSYFEECYKGLTSGSEE